MSSQNRCHIDTECLPVMNITQPINIPLCGIYGRSFAYYSMKERMPRIINKVIEYCHADGPQIKSAHNATDKDLQDFIQHLEKLRNEIITNQCFELLKVNTSDARKWNAWIESQDNPRYFSNLWLYSECYVYRRIWEVSEINNGLRSFDPFEDQKSKAFESTVEMMCVVAEKLTSMLTFGDKQTQKADFANLIKLCLWSNQCDLSLTNGSDLDFGSGEGAILDPFQMIKNFNDKLLVDHSGRVVDYVIEKTESISRERDGTGGTPVIFDIVCDNAGYELFADLCLGLFLISHKIVDKVRFHVKNIPWFISDVTPKDFKYVIKACREVKFSKTVTRPEPGVVTSEPLQKIAAQWQQLVDDGVIVVMHDDFWTSPHMYKHMETLEPSLYVKLQDAIAVLFKGDLNGRKLLNEMNWPTTTTFDHALQGFHPTPVVSVRTVKSNLICGLPPGKADQLDKLDDQWMLTGQYGTILFSEKVVPLKWTDIEKLNGHKNL